MLQRSAVCPLFWPCKRTTRTLAFVLLSSTQDSHETYTTSGALGGAGGGGPGGGGEGVGLGGGGLGGGGDGGDGGVFAIHSLEYVTVVSRNALTCT